MRTKDLFRFDGSDAMESVGCDGVDPSVGGGVDSSLTIAV